MPELPEVETLKNSIEPKIIGMRIISITKKRNTLRYILPSFTNAEDSIIESCTRRAKYLLLHLGNKQTLIIHLGMSGQLLFKTDNLEPNKHDHIIIELSKHTLIYRDPRRFGMMDLVDTATLLQHKYFINLGPEPLSADFNAEYLHSVLAKRSIPIKQAIMDNNIIVGVGNIYASESLFKAQIHPQTIANIVSLQQLIILVDEIQATLQEAIKAGGSSIKDFVNSENNSGYFQQQLFVYGREKHPCKKCSTPIEKIIQGGRATFFCNKCQKI